MDIKKTGKFIQDKRKELNMSQQALGEYLFVTDKAVSKWERGLACPDIENLKKMALLFHCNISEIINGRQMDIYHSSNLPTQSADEIEISEDFSCDVTVEFDLASTKTISPFLFGDNLEHTRDCVNGGISAQLLKNRKFAGKPGRYGCAEFFYQIGEKTYLSFSAPYTCHSEGYKMKRAHECNSQMICNYHSDTPAGIGQKNIPVQANVSYVFSVAAKAFEKTTVTVQLTSVDGLIYDKKEVLIQNNEFEELQVILTPNTDDPSASLEVFFTQQGSVCIGALSLMPSNNFRGMRWDVIEKMKEIGIKLLRWPGGNFAGEYNWKDGFLPRDKRAPFQSYLWLETQPHTLGYDFHELNTDDFIALCNEIGAEPYITINPTWNTPEESAQWVEYCNGDMTTPYGKIRADRGHPAPYNVQFWSLGNEAGYGHMEGANTPYEYAKVVSTHAKAMLEVTPTLTLCSSGPYPNAEWALHSVRALKKVAGVVSLHHYVSYPEFIDPAKRKEEYNTFINTVKTEFLFRLHQLREQINDDDIKISYDEWNAWNAWYRGGSVCEGILSAAFLNMLFMNAPKYGVELACHFESVNEGAMQVHPGKITLTPTGQVLAIMNHHSGGLICALQDDVVVTRRDKTISCTFINRSYDESKTFIFPGVGHVKSGVLYSSEDIVPHTVFQTDTLSVEQTGDSRKIVLPCHSIAHITISMEEVSA